MRKLFFSGVFLAVFTFAAEAQSQEMPWCMSGYTDKAVMRFVRMYQREGVSFYCREDGWPAFKWEKESVNEAEKIVNGQLLRMFVIYPILKQKCLYDRSFMCPNWLKKQLGIQW